MISKNAKAIVAGSLLAISFFGAAQAQQDGPPAIIEIFGCTYNDGNDMSDFMAVADRWNDWADERNITDYTANVLTPYLYSPAFPYEVLWFGVYPNAEAMGAGQAQWLAEGGDMNDEFLEVVTCSTHGNFAGIATHVPANPPNQDDGMVNLTQFQDCTLVNESSAGEALAAHREWGDYVAEAGSDVFAAALFPVAGENPAAEYNYKAVTNFSSAVAYGNNLSVVIPRALQRRNQIFGRVTQCDRPRVYTVTQVRAAGGGGQD